MGRPKYLWPLQTSSMQCQRINGKLVYLYMLPNGQQARLFADEVFHVRGISLDGIWGLAPITYARENIGLSLAAQEHGSRLFSNNAVPKGVIETPSKFKDEEVLTRFRRQVEDAHQGLSKAHRVMILENGMQWKSTGLPPEDAQFLETRKFGIEDVARFFRLEASKLQHGDKRAFASVEQDSLNHVMFTLRPWCVFFEQAIRRSLLMRSERRQYFAEHLVDGFLRGDIGARFEAYVKGINNGILNIDEVRGMENRNPLPGGLGQKHRVPLNTVALGEEKKDPPAPKKPASSDGKPDDKEPAASQG
jgi:HK97 family phage portal protein